MTKVFISYSHDSEAHRNLVSQFAAALRELPGLEVSLDADMLPGGPAEGWPLWCERQFHSADRVLVICTAAYRRRYEGMEPPGMGLGAVFEAGVVRQYLYDCGGVNPKVRAILFGPTDEPNIPTQLRPYHKYIPTVSADFENLKRWLMTATQAPTPPSPGRPGAPGSPLPSTSSIHTPVISTPSGGGPRSVMLSTAWGAGVGALIMLIVVGSYAASEPDKLAGGAFFGAIVGAAAGLAIGRRRAALWRAAVVAVVLVGLALATDNIFVFGAAFPVAGLIGRLWANRSVQDHTRTLHV